MCQILNTLNAFNYSSLVGTVIEKKEGALLGAMLNSFVRDYPGIDIQKLLDEESCQSYEELSHLLSHDDDDRLQNFSQNMMETLRASKPLIC